MRNLQFKRKSKSVQSEDDVKKKKRTSPLQFTATIRKESSIKSKVNENKGANFMVVNNYSYNLLLLCWLIFEMK